MRRHWFLLTAALAVGLSAAAGGAVGPGAAPADDRLPDHYRTFTAALDAI